MLCTMRTTRAAEWASVLFEMKRNKVKSVLCEMKICTLLKSVCEEASANPLFSYNHHRDTRFLSLLLRRPRQKAYLTSYLENTDLENSDQRPEKFETSECFKDLDPKKKTIFHRVFAANCNVMKSVCVTQFHSCFKINLCKDERD